MVVGAVIVFPLHMSSNVTVNVAEALTGKLKGRDAVKMQSRVPK